ncbi:riboflavin kinase [Gastrophryne carolinensis]
MSQALACSSRLGSGAAVAVGAVGGAAVLALCGVDGPRSIAARPVERAREPSAVETPLPSATTKSKTPRAGAMAALPYFCRGPVVQGFGRGSKELGIPTANFPEHVVDNLPTDLSTGIYFGWGCVGNGEVYKMVMSIGWNPYYKNVKKSVETHIIHRFTEDFYGEVLSIVIVGYIRPEKSFDSLDALITAIHGDIEEAKRQLDLPEFKKLKDKYFCNSHKIMNGH